MGRELHFEGTRASTANKRDPSVNKAATRGFMRDML